MKFTVIVAIDIDADDRDDALDAGDYLMTTTQEPTRAWRILAALDDVNLQRQNNGRTGESRRT